MAKSNEHMFLELNLTDTQAETMISGIVGGVEMYLLKNNLGEHFDAIKSQMNYDAKLYLTKINLSSNIY